MVDQRMGMDVAAGRSQVERLLDRRREVLDARDGVVVLRHRQGDAGDVDFLEGVPPDQWLDHLPGDGNHRHGIQHGISQASDKVGSAGARGGHAHARLARCPGVTLRRHGGPLLKAHQDVMEACGRKRVVERDHRATRIAKDGIDARVLESLAYNLGARQDWSLSSLVFRWRISARVRHIGCCHGSPLSGNLRTVSGYRSRLPVSNIKKAPRIREAYPLD
jgi:hypothetical protein